MLGVALAWVLLAAEPQLVDIVELEPRVRLDIKYATRDNFTGVQLYPIARCLLRPAVAQMVVKAQRHLDKHAPGNTLLLKDCYRPDSVQRRMWDVVRGTTKAPYVANPETPTGSVHSYGAAVDVTLAGADGAELDMGTPYDFLGPLAEPRREAEYLRQGRLTAAQVRSRSLLRAAMVDAGGFLQLATEWWHFDALRGAALRERYQRLDIPLETQP